MSGSACGTALGQGRVFFSSRILSEITKGINYSGRPGRGGNNTSKSLMEMHTQTPPHVKWDDSCFEKRASGSTVPPPRPSPVPPQPGEQPLPGLGFAAEDAPHRCHRAGQRARRSATPPSRPSHTLNMLVFLHRVILWCSAINYCYTTIINNFLNENDSVDLRCILIIRVKHNYTAALSWHVDSFRAQFCFNTLIM